MAGFLSPLLRMLAAIGSLPRATSSRFVFGASTVSAQFTGDVVLLDAVVCVRRKERETVRGVQTKYSCTGLTERMTTISRPGERLAQRARGGRLTWEQRTIASET